MLMMVLAVKNVHMGGKNYFLTALIIITHSCPIYRVFHDLWTLLQEVISKVFVIKKVHKNMCPVTEL